MDFDNRKVYGDTSITDGLVFLIFRAVFAIFGVFACVFGLNYARRSTADTPSEE